MTDTYDTQHAHDAPQAESFRAGKVAAENRWLLAIVGGVSVLAGLFALAMPFLASLTATALVGWILIISGVVGLVTAVRRKAGWSLGASFAFAIVCVIGGVVMLAQPIMGLFALTTVLIAHFAASGVLRLFYGFRALRDGGGWMVAAGLFPLLLAALLFFGLPFSAAWVPGVMLGVDLILWGALQIALAVQIATGPEPSKNDATSGTTA